MKTHIHVVILRDQYKCSYCHVGYRFVLFADFCVADCFGVFVDNNNIKLTAEHLIYSHPSIAVVLSKLFQLIMLYGHVPSGFRHSYIVPVPKIKDFRTKSVACDDFRGIAISPILSKVFEHCILDIFHTWCSSFDTQFGFKKGSGCRNAIYSFRKAVDNITQNGSTANVCSVDLRKAFEKVNHCGLYIKLMKRFVPTALLQ